MIAYYLMKCLTGFPLISNRDPGKTDPNVPKSDISWPLFTTESENYLAIDLEPRVESKLEADRVVFWEDFLPSLAKRIRKDEL